MDVSDMVFIDAPGAGFSRIAGRDKEKAFWGVDEDARPSPASSPPSCRNTAAGIRPSTCSVKATAHRARRC